MWQNLPFWPVWDVIIALLRCLFWEQFYTFITPRRTCAGSTLRVVDHTEHKVDGTWAYTRLFSPVLTFSWRTAGSLRSIVLHIINNDRMRDGGPLCAEVPLLPGFTVGYPMVIQSYHSFFRESGSNTAQRPPSFLTPLREERPPCASSP